MRNRKHLVSVVVAAAAAVSLTACGSDTTAKTVDNARKDGVEVKDASAELGLGNPTKDLCGGKTYTIGYDVFSDTQEFAAAMTKNMEDVAKELGCVEIVTLTDNADPATALSNVKTFVERKVDGVVLFQVIASAQAGLMKTLDAAGIPAVAVAVPAPGAPFLSINDKEAGEIAGTNLAQKLLDQGQEKDAYLLLGAFPAGGSSTIDRAEGVTAGVQSKIADFPKDHVITVDGGASADSGYQAVTNVLSKIPTDAPVAVTGVNDDVISGMARALETGGRTKNVYVSGMGVVAPSGAKYICESPQYIGGVQFAPETWGTYVIPAILAQMQQKKLDDTVYIPQQWMDSVAVKKAYPAACS